jgi:hypothetical protein
VIQRIRPNSIRPVSEPAFPFRRPEEEIVYDAEFSQWYKKSHSNSDQDAPPVAPEDAMPQPQTTLEDLLVLANARDFEDRLLRLRRGSSRYLAYVAPNPYIEVADVFETQDNGQYVFDFMIIPPAQGEILNQSA